MKGYNKNGVKTKRKARGTVYILRFDLRSGEVAYKIGMTTRKLLWRIQEIIASYYYNYGYIPKVTPIRQGKSKYYIEVEQALLKKSEHWKYNSTKKIEGVTEFRTGVNTKELINWYDGMITRELWDEHKAVTVNVPKMVSIDELEPIVLDM